ncbi:hypothetical protein [Acuticoccus sediminis]|uniref:hypothetical protein n=1 Tax=Acuticoccus sediminis TaxID=2184697 RepID=UPI0013912703|nr:hypothetical protein [Acuticoccus sediminis]
MDHDKLVAYDVDNGWLGVIGPGRVLAKTLVVDGAAISISYQEPEGTVTISVDAEAGATADMTGAEIVAAVNDALGSSTWQSGGTADLLVYSVNGLTGDVVLTSDEIDDSGSTEKRFITQTLLNKLSNIEIGATADQTGAEMVTLINGALGSTDWQSGGAGGGAVDSVNGQTGAVVLTADDIDDSATVKVFFSASERVKLSNIDEYATDDQTGSEIVAAINDELGSANWQSGGSGGEVTSVNNRTGDVVISPDDLDDATTSHKFISQAQLSKLSGIQAGATDDLTASEIVTLVDADGTAKSALKTALAVPVAAGDIGAVPTTRTVGTGEGLQGGGSLGTNRTISLSAATIASLNRADNAAPSSEVVGLVYGAAVELT